MRVVEIYARDSIYSRVHFRTKRGDVVVKVINAWASTKMTINIKLCSMPFRATIVSEFVSSKKNE